MGVDCKSTGSAYVGSNPTRPIIRFPGFVGGYFRKEILQQAGDSVPGFRYAHVAQR